MSLQQDIQTYTSLPELSSRTAFIESVTIFSLIRLKPRTKLDLTVDIL